MSECGSFRLTGEHQERGIYPERDSAVPRRGRLTIHQVPCEETAVSAVPTGDIENFVAGRSERLDATEKGFEIKEDE